MLRDAGVTAYAFQQLAALKKWGATWPECSRHGLLIKSTVLLGITLVRLILRTLSRCPCQGLVQLPFHWPLGDGAIPSHARLL